MNAILFAFPQNESLTQNIASQLDLPVGEIGLRQFPDGESYVRLLSPVAGKAVIFVCALNQPNEKLLPLLLLAAAAKEAGATHVILVAPYLAYLRQDKIFRPGEALSAQVLAKNLSGSFDGLITLDPHLHRIKSLDDIFKIPSLALHVVEPIVYWLKNQAYPSFIVGPDKESEQWVKVIAQKADLPYAIITKERLGDYSVTVRLPEIATYRSLQPILIDDIISTGVSIVASAKNLMQAGFLPPHSVAVHGIFAGDAYVNLQQLGIKEIVTSNTILHPSNQLDVSGIIAEGIKELFLEIEKK